MLFSIITICKDNMYGLEKTLTSILNQSIRDWEYIIVIGQSSDQSLKVAREFGNDARFTIVEQVGNGIYEAMNVGLFLAKGDFVNFMNSGDVFCNSEVLENCKGRILKTPEIGLFFGGYLYLGKNGVLIEHVKSEIEISPYHFAFTRRACHQSMFFNLELTQSLGGYNLKYRFASDFHLALKVLLASSALRLDFNISKIQRDGVSESNIREVISERHKIRQELLTGVWSLTFNSIWTLLLLFKIHIFPNKN